MPPSPPHVLPQQSIDRKLTEQDSLSAEWKSARHGMATHIRDAMLIHFELTFLNGSRFKRVQFSL